MATRFQLTPYAAELAGLANYPQLTHIAGIPVLAFDAATNESVVWTVRLPTNVAWTGSATLAAYGFMASATAGTVDVNCEIMAVTPGDALDLSSATSYDAANNVSGTVVPATAGYLFQVVINLTNFDGGVAGDWVRLRLTRRADTDTAAGDWYLVMVGLGDGA